MAKHITDLAADKADGGRTGRRRRRGRTFGKPSVPGPSTNPQTNALIHEIVLRSGGRMVRKAMEKGLLARRYGADVAKDAVDNRSLVSTLVSYGVTKVATRSLPGAALVGGSLLVKTLFDRSQSRRAAKNAGDAAIRDTAADD